MRLLEMDEVIKYLESTIATDPKYSDLKTTLIFDEPPIEEKTELVLVVSSFGPETLNAFDRRSIVRCAMYGSNSQYPQSDLEKNLNLIAWILTNKYSGNFHDFGCGVYNVVEADIGIPLMDEKMRNYRTLDFYFYYPLADE